jgi:hypothetical protein
MMASDYRGRISMNDGHTVKRAPQERVEGYWLVLHYTNNPPIRLDARSLDRVLADDRDLLLEVGRRVIALRITGERITAYELAEQLAPYARSAPITQQDVYEDARRRLARIADKDERMAPWLFFGSYPVRVSDEIIYIGEFACTIFDAERYARVGGELPLPNGRMQAGLVILVIAARKRTDDAALLSRRITEYEARFKPGISKE